jgi:hypothetical protein
MQNAARAVNKRSVARDTHRKVGMVGDVSRVCSEPWRQHGLAPFVSHRKKRASEFNEKESARD